MKYTVVAYAEGGLPRKEATITARNKDEAWSKAWRMFPNITKWEYLRRSNYDTQWKNRC